MALKAVPLTRQCSGMCTLHCHSARDPGAEHAEIRETMKWPLMVVGNLDEGHEIQCDYCGHTLWDVGLSSATSLGFDLQLVYEKVFDHRMDGCNGRTE